MRDLLLRWFKEAHMQKPWPQMSEGDQRTWINRIEERAELLVDQVIEHVNHGDFPVVNAKIDSFTVKNGEVKVVTKGFADNDMLAILNSAGEKRVQITVMRNDQFDQERDTLHPEPDQPGLPGVKMGDAPGFEDDDQQPQVDEPPVDEQEQAEGDAVLKPKSDQWRGGFASRMAGHYRNENPFNVSTQLESFTDWHAGWDAGDFDATAPVLKPKDEAKPAVDPKPKRTTKPKVGPIVEPDIKVDEPPVEPDEIERLLPPAGGQQTDGDAGENGREAITDHEDTVIETVDQAHAYGMWCRKDGKGTGSNPFVPSSDFGKAWLRGYSDQRRKETTEEQNTEEF